VGVKLGAVSLDQPLKGTLVAAAGAVEKRLLFGSGS
jgi:hypothetical protein